MSTPRTDRFISLIDDTTIHKTDIDLIRANMVEWEGEINYYIGCLATFKRALQETDKLVLTAKHGEDISILETQYLNVTYQARVLLKNDEADLI